MNPIAVESIRSKLNRELLPRKDTFVYVADFSAALEYASVIEKNAKVIAVDTEHFNFSQMVMPTARFPYPVKRYNACGPFVALLQVSTKTQTYVFDILAMGDLPGVLKRVLEGSDAVKLVYDHNAEACALNNTFGVRLQHALDLQSLCDKLTRGALIHGVGLNRLPVSPSLQNTVRAFFGDNIDKGFQRFDWRRTNIPHAALRYAAEDAWLLIRLLQFVAAACSLVWTNWHLCDDMVEEVARELVREHGCKIPASVLTAAMPRTAISGYRVYRVHRNRRTCIFE